MDRILGMELLCFVSEDLEASDALEQDPAFQMLADSPLSGAAVAAPASPHARRVWRIDAAAPVNTTLECKELLKHLRHKEKVWEFDFV